MKKKKGKKEGSVTTEKLLGVPKSEFPQYFPYIIFCIIL